MAGPRSLPGGGGGAALAGHLGGGVFFLPMSTAAAAPAPAAADGAGGPAATRRAAALAGHLGGGGGGGVVAAGQEAAVARHWGAAAGTFTVALPESLADDAPWHVRRNARCPERLVRRFGAGGEAVGTLHENFEHAVAQHAGRPFLGSRAGEAAYRWTSYAEAARLRTCIGSALLRRGLRPGAHVGIYSVNCAEWMLVDLALHAYSMVVVPLYDTLGPDAVDYICRHAELEAVACSFAVLPTLLRATADAPGPRLVVVFGAQGRALPDVRGAAVTVVRLEELVEEGKAAPLPHVPPAPEDLFTICYTSGTTGVPKGAMLTHANIIASAAGGSETLQDVGPTDVHVSYLPLAHIYERSNVSFLTHRGAAIGFYRGDVLQLVDDIVALQPTVFCSVPRLLNRIYDKVQQQLQAGSPVARWLFQAACDAKLRAMAAGDPSGGRFGALWERLVFSKVQAKLGGRVLRVASGASPISPDVFNFLRCCFPQVYEGYGMTETTCMTSVTSPDDQLIGHVGAPVLSCEVKLVDLPEMGYSNDDRPFPRGEICVRGPSVFKGYYKNPDETRACLDEAGWLHTGDVGAWIEGGRLKIIDRKKNIFKLAQGEYVAPEKIENAYVRSPFVAQIFVYGDSLQAELVGIVVPDPDFALPWAKQHGLPEDLAALAADPKFRAAVFQSMQREAAAAKLRGFEHVKAIAVEAEAFAVENGLLTPTFKLKRPQAKKKYADAIAGLYAQLRA